MKRRVLAIIMVMMVIIGVMEVVPAKAATVSLSTSKKTVYAGSFFQLKLKNADGDVEWKSSKESVAQVLPSGIVVALKKGNVTITATYEGVAYGCTVTVKNPTVDKTKATMKVDDTLRLKMKGSNAVSWSSSNKKVATVDDGGLVKALMVGTTTITAKCEDGNEYTSKITVKNYNVKVGDTIKMGHYEQDNNALNGDEPIEWEVLEVKDGKALLITKDAIVSWELNPYACWEESPIRTWLNSDFYDNAFSESEKKKILNTVVTADPNPEVNAKQGNSTEDYIYIFSIDESLKYDKDSRKASISIRSQVALSEYPAIWLRTMGYSLTCIGNGEIIYKGIHSQYGSSSYNWKLRSTFDSYYYTCAICPVMWITID